MTAHDIHALSGAYAVNALDDLERARFEQHLAVCAECRAEVASLRETAAMLGEISSTPPPPALRARVLADIEHVRPLPPETDSSPAQPSASRRKRPSLRMLGAAAAVLTVVGVGTFTVIDQVRDEQSQVVDPVAQVLTADDAESVEVDLPGSASARVVRSPSHGKAVLVTEDMPAAPAGKVYEIWFQDPQGSMVPAGLMPEGSDQKVLLEGDASEATAVGITVEPAGGSEEPTSDPIVLFDLEQAT